MSNLIYDINDKPKKWYEWAMFSAQQLLSIFVATVLISNLCGTPISSCLFGTCVGTLIYQVITEFKSPMFISSCGATVSAVCGALSLNASNNNYLMVFCGGLVIMIVYVLFAIAVKTAGITSINKIFPPVIVGPITMVIGLNLATFIFTYCNVTNDQLRDISVVIAIVTMLIVAITSHYGKGFIKQIPFLLGLLGGYLIALIITLSTDIKIIDFSAFDNIKWYPDLVFLKWRASDFSFMNLWKTVLYFIPVAISAIFEHYSDHKTLSNIIGTDLTENPGLHKTLTGDGIASAVGTMLCGLPNTSYGESIATVGFSRVASVCVITTAAIAMGVMSFCGPLTAFIQTIPSCVFGGCAMILYGYISLSGLQTLINSKVDLSNNKNMIIVSVILTVGVSGIYIFDAAFSGVALAIILGVILNIILKDSK